MKLKWEPPKHPFLRLWQPLTALLLLVAAGTLGYKFTVGSGFSWYECLYEAIITLSTVGYEDRLGVRDSPPLLVITTVLALGGVATATWGASILTAAIVEGDLANYFKERKMEKQAAKMSGHTILCGAGETGIHVLQEYDRAGAPLVVIEHHSTRARELQEEFPAAVILSGDATDEELLSRAGIERAGKLIAALHEDRDNMFLVVSARALSPGLMIISKCVDPHRLSRFEKAGADFVVSPNQIGGMRMASHALRPHVVGFLDRMLKAEGDAMRVQEVIVAAGSQLAGRTVGEARFHETAGVRLIGAQPAADAPPVYNVPDDWPLKPGATLFFIGAGAQVEKMKRLAGG